MLIADLFILPAEECLNRAIDDIRAVEEEKRESILSEERRKNEELRAAMEELRVVSGVHNLGDSCIQNFHLGRYIIGCMVGYLVIR